MKFKRKQDKLEAGEDWDALTQTGHAAHGVNDRPNLNVNVSKQRLGR